MYQGRLDGGIKKAPAGLRCVDFVALPRPMDNRSLVGLVDQQCIESKPSCRYLDARL